MNIGRAIKLCRERKGLSRATLSDRTGLSLSYLSLLENDKRDPSISKVKLISESLGIPVSIIFFLAADKGQMESMSPELAEKLALFSLKLIEESDETDSALTIST